MLMRVKPNRPQVAKADFDKQVKETLLNKSELNLIILYQICLCFWLAMWPH